MKRFVWLLAVTAAAAMAAACSPGDTPPVQESQQPEAPVHGYEILHEYPHDADAFTQGLIYRDGLLYESTGRIGRSSLRKVQLETGEVIQQRPVDDRYFGEGLTEWRGRLMQLTPMRTEVTLPSALSQFGEPPTRFAAMKQRFSFVLVLVGRRLGVNVGARYDFATFEPQASFSYEGEGWGLTHDGRRLILSDGTSHLRFLDPEQFTEIGRVQVTDRGKPVDYLNELEFVEGEVYANVWFKDRIAIISPDSGQVTGWIDLGGLASRMVPPPNEAAGAVLNGIAYDAAGKRLFVTGKLWSRLFEIRLRH